ncbi:MAG: asparagine synthase C-terminal domain-containing protein, partial [Ferruginibacter sp.]
MSEDDIMEQFDFLLRDSVQKRLRSDVTIGSSLSGGLDSSALTSCILEHTSPEKFQTFSAVFPGFEKDESVYIDDLVKHFGIHNQKVYPTADGLIADFEKLCHHQEEPFPSSSIYAQFKVFETASNHRVPVLIDGQGADEILAGYNKYLHWFLQELVSNNKFARAKKERHLFKQHDMDLYWGIKNIFSAYLPSHTSIALEKREFNHITQHPDMSKEMLAVVRGSEWDGIYKPIVTKLNDILYFNVMENGLEELLRFSDRNSMAHSVEVRLPFLSAELVQFVFSLPSAYKIRDGYTKYILRKTMQSKLPDQVLWRTDKIGYEPPQQKWMQNKIFTEYIQESRKKLINAGVLKRSVLLKKVNPLGAHVANN